MKRKNILFAVLLLGCMLCVGFFIKSNIQQVEASSAYEEEGTRVLDSVYTCPKCGGRMVSSGYGTTVDTHVPILVEFDTSQMYVENTSDASCKKHLYEDNGVSVGSSPEMCMMDGVELRCSNYATSFGSPYRDHLQFEDDFHSRIVGMCVYYCESCLYAEPK